MSYFLDNYVYASYPVAERDNRGLRRAQLGALHSIAGHFTLRDDPAIVVMPTGSGKTAVLMLTAFVQRARRVLVVTPSVLVRQQIAERFAALDPLRDIGAIAAACAAPNVLEVAGRLSTVEAWKELEAYDVVVGTPSSLSHGVSGVALPPETLFDLVLVDEAHHGRARVWEELLESFPYAKQVHFTATPFRRDEKPLNGEIVYSFPLSEARRDNIFGQIEFVAVEAAHEPSDVAIARRAEAALREDHRDGHRHLLMVRTDTRKRADELHRVYQDNTELNLRRIHSGLSPTAVRRVIQQLREGELDGIICVDMLGEGFDLPALKVAAVHSPHKSLAVTLQFIGRFARETDFENSVAKFIAVPSEIEIEREKLYTENPAWQDLITNLSDGRVQAEVEMRERIVAFERKVEPVIEFSGVSLNALKPFHHVKIYRVLNHHHMLDVTVPIEVPAALEIVDSCYWVDEPRGTIVFATRERTRQPWTTLEEFDRVDFDLFVIHFARESNLLFINASRRSTSLYEYIANQLTGGRHSILPLKSINSVLGTLDNLNFHNVGMRRRGTHQYAEAYRTSAGGGIQNAINASDGSMYSRGHVAATGTTTEGKPVMIGYSSSSKVWSSENGLVPQLVDWIEQLAHRISTLQDVRVGSAIDYLSLGEALESIPDGVIAADWHRDAYGSTPRKLRHTQTDSHVSLLDLDIAVDHRASGGGTVRLKVQGEGIDLVLDESLTSAGPVFTIIEGDATPFEVTTGRDCVPLLTYLKHFPPQLFLHDFSHFDGINLFRESDDLPPFDRERLFPVPWLAAGVNIQREFYKPDMARDGRSIHEHLEAILPAQDCEVVFYDHGSGEMADFVTFARTEGAVRVAFYHCKGSGGETAATRIEDVKDVAGQTIKTLCWLKSPQALLKQVLYRNGLETPRFILGDPKLLAAILADTSTVGVEYEIVLVQPGLSRAAMNDQVAVVLAAADNYISRFKCLPLRLMVSA